MAERRIVELAGRWRGVLFAGLLTVAVAGCADLTRQDAKQWGALPPAPGYASVMSFNILVGGWPPERVLDAIGYTSPDLLCLQEMTPEFADAFDRRFAEAYPYRYFLPGPMAGGIGIASRYPLSERETLSLGTPYFPALAADAEFGAGTVKVACLHLMPPFAQLGAPASSSALYQRNKDVRLEQVRWLLDHLGDTDGPAILLGDMNEWPGHMALEALGEAGFVNACLDLDGQCGPTWPGDAVSWPAVVQIDHIFGRDIEFRRAVVLEAGGSDHYPVVAQFRPVGPAGR